MTKVIEKAAEQTSNMNPADPLSAMLDSIYNEDCLEGMKRIPDRSIDMILCDLPYGTTQNKWDCVIPFGDLWKQYERVVKENGAIVLTADGLFTAKTMLSNEKLFRYKLIWDKKNTTGFLNAKRMPLRRHEDILVFYAKQPTYNPQMVVRGKPRKKGGYAGGNKGCYGDYGDQVSLNNSYYPTSILEFGNANQGEKIHPTQKSCALFEYLIKTYTNENDIVLDNCMGSGTTAIAAINTGRRFVGFETNREYFVALQERIANRRSELRGE